MIRRLTLRICTLVLFALLYATASAQSFASGLQLTAPASGALVPAGQPLTITWTGGNPAGTVAFYFVDIALNAVADTISAVPNSGSLVWPFPSGGCGRAYKFVIVDIQTGSEYHGPIFTAVCPTTVHVANGDVAGLAAAILASNANPGPDVINLAPGGTYTLTAIADNGLAFYCCGPAGLPFVQGPLTINGNGATIQRSNAPGTPAFGILEVASQPYNRNQSNLTLDGVILTGGKAGVNVYGSPTGGAVSIWQSTASIRNTSIVDNAEAGIFNYCGTLTVTNSTISHNTREGGGYGGGGILSFSCAEGFAMTSISFSTIFENTADVGDSLSTAFEPPGSVVVKNSILASPTRGGQGVCWQSGAGAIVSAGHNIVGDSSCGFNGPGDVIMANPLLGPLTNNGGPTPTHLPLTGSPAIDAVPLTDCTEVSGAAVVRDQRGVVRPQGAGCDIGSVDVAGDTTAPVIIPSWTGTTMNGWHNQPVTVSWSVTDPESGIASTSGCGTAVLSADTVGEPLTCSAVNGVGIGRSRTEFFSIDQTPPVISGSRTPPPNGAGWNNGNVTVDFACADALSGVFHLSPISMTLSAEGAGLSAGGSCVDKAGNTAATVVGGINIDKTAPSTSGVQANPNPVPLNTSVVLAASLGDGGSGLVRGEYSIDGSTPVTLALASGATAAVSGTIPAFPETGVYNICVRAVDLAGNVGANDCVLVPVYDPSGGFVTGGGWINSPAGAYNADPTLTGKATFGFESRYKPGAQVPTGNTQFHFKAGDLNFKSTSYEWLVVAGKKAQYKGSGTINGAGNYNFMLTAIDGDLPGGGNQDRFRLKITGPGGLVYDNQMGANDGDDPTTALGGGSIVIHKP